MNSAKDILVNHQLFKGLLDENYSQSEFSVRCLKEIPTPELGEAISYLRDKMKQLENISENLIIKNLDSIIRDGNRLDESKTDDFETLQNKITESETAMKFIQTNFLSKYDAVENSYIRLQQTYATKILATGYLKFIESTENLAAMLNRKYDLLQASKLCRVCLDLVQLHDFEGLVKFTELFDSLKQSQALLHKQAEELLDKSLAGLNFFDSKHCFQAFANLGLLQRKVQEITNGFLKDNFSVIKALLTQPPFSLDKELKLSEVSKHIQEYKLQIKRSINDMLENSLKAWVVEVGLDDLQHVLHGTNMVDLFRLYAGKMRSILIQSIEKLNSSRQKFMNNFNLFYSTVGFIVACFDELTEKILIFMINHPSSISSKLIPKKDINLLEGARECVTEGFQIFLEQSPLFDWSTLENSLSESIVNEEGWRISTSCFNTFNNTFILVCKVIESFNRQDHLVELLLSQLCVFFEALFEELHETLNSQIYDSETTDAVDLRRQKIRGSYKANEFLLFASKELSGVLNSLSKLSICESSKHEEHGVTMTSDLLNIVISQKQFFARSFLQFTHEHFQGLEKTGYTKFIMFFFDEDRIDILFRLLESKSSPNQKEKVVLLLFFCEYLDAVQSDGERTTQSSLFQLSEDYLKQQLTRMLPTGRGSKGRYYESVRLIFGSVYPDAKFENNN